MNVSFAPGDLVFARGREWVALPSPNLDTLCLRPLSGAEGDIQVLHPALERNPVRPAQFGLPEVADGVPCATRDAALLLSQALRLSLRRGAGPFRSAARVAFESSPMAAVRQWRSPVLLIHGDDDRNVPFSETVTLVEALRRQGVEFEQLIFPDDVHDFLIHSHWLEAYHAAADFLRRHLMKS